MGKQNDEASKCTKTDAKPAKMSQRSGFNRVNHLSDPGFRGSPLLHILEGYGLLEEPSVPLFLTRGNLYFYLFLFI